MSNIWNRFNPSSLIGAMCRITFVPNCKKGANKRDREIENKPKTNNKKNKNSWENETKHKSLASLMLKCVFIISAKRKRRHIQTFYWRKSLLKPVLRRSQVIFGYIPALSRWVLVAFPTFKIRSDSGVVTWNFAHEFVQKLGWRHRGGGFPRRCFFRCR